MTTRLPVETGLMLMSFGSGCVDVLSFRFLGETLPSAMTGNVALLGLKLGRGDVSAATPGLCALASFVIGLLVGARFLRGAAARRRVALTLGLEAALLLGLAATFVSGEVAPWHYALIGLAALAMGLQSAVAHRVGSSISTTYFTGMMASIVFASAETPGAVLARKGWPLLALLLYLGGAFAGGCYGKGGALGPLAALPFVPSAIAAALAIVIAASHARVDVA